MNNNFDSEEDLEYPEELYSVVELSDSILELTEKLELIRGKLDDFEQRYLEEFRRTTRMRRLRDSKFNKA